MPAKKLLSVLLILNFSLLFANEADDAGYLYSKGFDCYDESDYISAISYFEKALPLYIKAYGEKHIYTGDVYYMLGVSFHQTKSYDKSIENYSLALEIYKKTFGMDSLDVASAFESIGLVLYDIERYDDAISYHQKALEIRQKLLPPDHEKIATSYYNLAINYEVKAEYDASLAFFQKSLELRIKCYGENNAETATTYDSIGRLYYFKGNYNEALLNYSKALDIYEELYGENSFEAWNVFSNIAGVYCVLQDYENALSIYLYLLELYLNTVGKNNIQTAYAYNNLGVVYDELGELEEALSAYKESLEILKIVSPDKSTDTARAYLNIGHTYQAMGDYANAYAYLSTALSIYTEIYGTKNPDIALIYLDLGVVLRSEGRYDEALSYILKSKEVYESIAGEKHIQVCRVYSEIGFIYFNKEDYNNALLYYRKAMNTLFDIFGYETLDIADCYDDIALVYHILGYYDDALSLYKDAVAVYEHELGVDNIRTATEYVNLGWQYAGMNETSETVKSFKTALAGLKNSTKYKLSLTLLTGILSCAKKYNYSSDVNFIRDIINVGDEIIEKAYQKMSSTTQKQDFLLEAMPLYYYAIQFESEQNNHPKVLEYSEKIRNRSFLDQIGTENALKLNGISESKRQEIKNQIETMEKSRRIIEEQNNLEITNRDINKTKEATKSFTEAENKLKKLDSEIGKQIPQYKMLRTPKTISASEAQKYCGKNRAILEYVLYNFDSEDKTASQNFAYCIVITNKKIQTVTLDSDFDYIKAVNNFRDGLTHRPQYSEVKFEKERNELYEKLIAPVLPFISSQKEILIVPDANLSFLPFDILREKPESRDFGEKRVIAFSPSISVSVITEKYKSSSSDMLGFGGAWYDKTLTKEEHMTLLSGSSNKTNDRFYSLDTTQMKLSTEELQKIMELEGPQKYFDAKNLLWKDLPGTVAELEKLKNETFKKGTFKIQLDASENNLKNLSENGSLNKYSVIHFACHGYFDNDFSEMSSIVFSEASGQLDNSSNDDGYLSVSEAATLNLNAQAVCLSACQTGLSEIKKGAGMVGLSRAFMVAGANKVIVTLWSVDDDATTEFITRMYKKVQSGKSYEEAIKLVKQEFRNSK